MVQNIQMEREIIERIVSHSLKRVKNFDHPVSLGETSKIITCDLLEYIKTLTFNQMENAIISTNNKKLSDLESQYNKMKRAHDKLAEQLKLKGKS